MQKGSLFSIKHIVASSAVSIPGSNVEAGNYSSTADLVLNAQIPFGNPCQQCSGCMWWERDSEVHKELEIISYLPSRGIDFQTVQVAPQSLAEAFVQIIPGHMDWPIKMNALKEWSEVAVPSILEEPIKITA